MDGAAIVGYLPGALNHEVETSLLQTIGPIAIACARQPVFP
jgi:hypothetical protein